MIRFSTTIRQFAKHGEKTGWSYVEISRKQAEKLKPDCKVSFRVKGQLDEYQIQKTAILPMGDGSFILPINATMRRATKKRAGDKIQVALETDERELTIPAEFMKCLKDDPKALDFFRTLPKSHQNYINKWIDSAKTLPTKTKRITAAVMALSSGQGFKEMLRSTREQLL